MDADDGPIALLDLFLSKCEASHEGRVEPSFNPERVLGPALTLGRLSQQWELHGLIVARCARKSSDPRGSPEHPRTAPASERGSSEV